MISRIWRGWTSQENGDAYEQLLREEILPGIAARQVAGYEGAYLLRRDLDDEVEFVTILWFESLDVVRAFAGNEYETAVVPPKARELLARFDKHSAHYETLVKP
jgi:heme-degrading monooxygenase HmoA